MFFHFRSWLRASWARMSGQRRRSSVTPFRHERVPWKLGFEVLESRETPAAVSFEAVAYLIDMGQATQTVGNALKPYGLVYDMVTNYKVPVNWAINPAKATFRLDAGDTIPVDFTATTTTGTKNYAGGSFIIDAAFLTPA